MNERRTRRKEAATPAKSQPDARTAARPGESAPPPVIVGRQQLAAILGCHPDRISEYTHAGMSVLHRGGVGGDEGHRRSRYDAILCAQWVRRHRPGSVLAQEQRALLDQKRREEIELRLQVKRGEVISTAAVKADWSRHIITAKNKLLGVPTRLKGRRPDVLRADVEAVDALIREALEELADGAADREEPS